MRIVDLSVPISEKVKEITSKAEGAPSITYFNHKEGAGMMSRMFGCKEEDFPVPGEGWGVEEIYLTTHSGTHMDAPYHFGALSEGKPSQTIDQMPLELCYADGVVLDFSKAPEGSLIEIDDMKRELDRIEYQLKPFDIVLLRTDWNLYWGTQKYFRDMPGASKKSTLWLVEQGIRVVGTDSPGWDRDFGAMREYYKQTGDASVFWEAHFAGMTRSYWQIEKMANFNMLPSHGFKICCFPVQIERASAGWVRPVAILKD